MKTISLPLFGSLMIVGLILGIGIGYYLTPEYQMTMFEKENMDLGSNSRMVDLAYLNGMIGHHQQALELAIQLEKGSQRPELRALSRDIQENEPTLIQKLYQYKQDFFNDTRQVRTPPVPNLGQVDPTFDLRFLNALISHHQAGIAMAQEVQTKSTRSEILNDAMAVESNLADSLVTLTNYRTLWYQI